MTEKAPFRARLGAVCIAAAGVVALSSCGGVTNPQAGAPTTAPSSRADDGGDPGSASDAAVLVKNIAFDPASLEVEVGTEVLWTNDDGPVRHTVTSGQPPTDAVPGLSEGKPAKKTGVFDGDLPQGGATYSFTFEKAGAYAYFCEVHPSMTGTIVVR
ncbi:MAG: plastocyanin/azurin family copper-binding protein [Actinomycetota bacterium]